MRTAYAPFCALAGRSQSDDPTAFRAAPFGMPTTEEGRDALMIREAGTGFRINARKGDGKGDMTISQLRNASSTSDR
ncbi:MAG TPA: hypothetical protein VGA75_12295 [Paracoccaceae bacterium]